MSRDGMLQNLDDLTEAFRRLGLEDEGHRALVARLREFCRRYVRLEQKLIGDVPLSFPAYLLEARLPEDPIAAGEGLALLERRRLALGHEETGEIRELLDRQGFKVYRPEFPPGSPVEGIFLFDRDAGPVFAEDAALSDGDADFVLACLYGHYLADHDPYEIRLLARGGGADRDANDVRARAFAAAFLVDRGGLEAYLREAGQAQGAPLDAEAVYQLAVFFEVGYRALLLRLLSLGLVRAADVEALVVRLEAEFGATVPPREEGAIPERFLRLALEAHARGILTPSALARYLETDPATARKLASRFALIAERPAEPGEPERA